MTAGFDVRPLEGDARLVTSPMPDRHSASVVLMFGVGSRYEDDRRGGISHFIEHLLFKGTARRPTAKLIAEAIEGVGGLMNASTDKEVTSYWARVPIEHLELAVDVLGDIVSASQLAPDDVDRERMVILEELKMYQDLPQDYVHSLFEELMWPAHPLGRDIAGTEESVKELSRQELVQFLAGEYTSRRLVASVSGGVEPNQVAHLMREHLQLGATAAGGCEAAPPFPERPVVRLLNKKTEQAHICLGTRAISYLDEDRYSLDLINTILGEGMSSRLFLEIREKRGLAYDVHSYTSKQRDTGYFAVYAGVDPGKAEETVRAVRGLLEGMVEVPVPEAELRKAKEFTKGRLRLGLESTNSVASWTGQQLLLAGRVRTLEEVVDSVEAVTAEDIQRVAARVLSQPLQMAVIGPFSSESTFQAAIGA